MEEKFYLVKLLTNNKGQDGSSIAVFPSYDKAIVSYHQTLATYHNVADVLYAVCQILDVNGTCMISEIVDHVPHPEVTE